MSRKSPDAGTLTLRQDWLAGAPGFELRNVDLRNAL
jgi:hypothetical protein